MKHVEEDWERLSKMDRMYLIEANQRMIEEWQQYMEYEELLPAKIELKIKKHELEGQ